MPPDFAPMFGSFHPVQLCAVTEASIYRFEIDFTVGHFRLLPAKLGTASRTRDFPLITDYESRVLVFVQTWPDRNYTFHLPREIRTASLLGSKFNNYQLRKAFESSILRLQRIY
jgi:hypothetical protein